MDKAALQVRLGRAVRARRERLGFSQDTFADRIAMHRAYYAAIERGEKNPTLATLVRVADGLDTTVHEILRDGGL